MFHNTRINNRLSILAFLLGLFITGSALLPPAVELLVDNGLAPNAAPEMLAGPEVDPDHG